MKKLDFTKIIDQASFVVGKTWPLYSFVTSNPLSGYEELPFQNAIKEAGENYGNFTLPSASMFREAWENHSINNDILQQLLVAHNFQYSAEFYLSKIENEKTSQFKNVNHALDVIVAKWLSVFLDEGIAEWHMPNKRDGFYSAWRKLAPYDKKIDVKSIEQIPETAEDALNLILKDYTLEQQLAIFKYHIAALPGYTGYIKYRMSEQSTWQEKSPITLMDYLGMRLLVATQLNINILPNNNQTNQLNDLNELKYVWLMAWEKTYQAKLVQKLNKNNHSIDNSKEKNLLAQFVFCIDTRSELIRRGIEAGGKYETFGYAGFFGLATDYVDLKTGYVRKSCPPIVSSAYQITECANGGKTSTLEKYKNKLETKNFTNFLTTRLKNMLPSAFGYVEGIGIFYGLRLIARTIAPNLKFQNSVSHEEFCEPTIRPNLGLNKEVADIPLLEKVAIVKSAFDLLGWRNFAPIVVFVGHGSHSTNNPFASSLDCGACAASPGRHNARMLAKIANLNEVRMVLSVEFDIHIPEQTIFMGAEHDTTTDKIVLFDAEIPKSHFEKVTLLKLDLINIQETTIKERIGMSAHDSDKALYKSNNWAETRPEWGLARNAGFIVGPRNLTENIDLNSRCFLHSYDWKLDLNGSALETIMQGPMVVTQWINSHYYFSTVDNENFGGGSKITHNVVGKFGVVQGNGGDLKFGLPLQSVKSMDDELFHQPLRLTVIIQSPTKIVEEILDRNLNLKSLVQNKWIYLLVMDPESDHKTFCYKNTGSWTLINELQSNLATAI